MGCRNAALVLRLYKEGMIHLSEKDLQFISGVTAR